MPIFQQFVDSQVSGISPQSPYNKYEGYDALGNLAGGVLGLAETLIEKQQDQAELEISNNYLSALQEAGQLRQRGELQASRSRIRDANIALVRAGGDPSDKAFQQVRDDLGIGDFFMEDPQERVMKALMDSPTYKGEIALAMKQNPKASPDQVHAIAMQNTMNLESQRAMRERGLFSEEQHADSLIFDANRQIETFSQLVLGFMEDNMITSDEMNQIQVAKENLRQQVTAQTASYKDDANRRRVNDLLDNVDEFYKIAENFAGMSNLDERIRENLFTNLLKIQDNNNYPVGPDQTPLSWEDISAWHTFTNARDPAVQTRLLHENGPRIQRVIEAYKYVGGYVKKMQTPFSIEGRSLSDDTLDPENRVAPAAMAHAKEVFKDAKSAYEVASMLSNSTRSMDASSLVDRNNAEAFVVETAAALYAIEASVEEDGFISETGIKAILTGKRKEFFEVISREHKDLYFDFMESMVLTNSKYQDKVRARKLALEGLGFKFSESGDLEPDLQTMKSAGVFGQGERGEAISGALLGYARDAYNMPSQSEEAVLAALIGDSQAKLQDYMNKEHVRTGGNYSDRNRRALAEAGSSLLIRSMDEHNPMLHKNMFKSAVALSEFVGDVIQFSAKAPEVSTKELGRLLPLRGIIDRTEGLGDYNTLWGRAETKSLKGDQRVSTMTVDQVIEYTKPGGTYRSTVGGDGEVGRYQIIHNTLKTLKKEMQSDYPGIGLLTFDSDMQDAMFVHLVNKAIKSKNTIPEMREALKGVWFGLKDSATDEEIDEALRKGFTDVRE